MILQIYESIICNTRSYKYVSKLPGGYLCRKTIDCHDEKIRKKINYILNVLSDDELEYIYRNIHEFTRFIHKDQVTTLKDIKRKNKAD